MKTKLTLTVDEEVIRRAKEVARNSGVSLSGLIENSLLQLIQHEQRETETGPTTLIRSLKGSIRIPANADYPSLRTAKLTGKYLQP